MFCTLSTLYLSLPLCSALQALKECFETKNVPMLQQVLSNLPKEEAAYHMQRCVDSGLWVTDAKAAGGWVVVGGAWGVA